MLTNSEKLRSDFVTKQLESVSHNQFVDNLVSRLVLDHENDLSSPENTLKKMRRPLFNAPGNPKDLKLLVNGQSGTIDNTLGIFEGNAVNRSNNNIGASKHHVSAITNNGVPAKAVMTSKAIMPNSSITKYSFGNSNLGKPAKIPYTVKYPTGLSNTHPRYNGSNKTSNGNAGVDNFLSLPKMTKSSEQAMSKVNDPTNITCSSNNQIKEYERLYTKGVSTNSSTRPIIGARKVQKSMVLPSDASLPNFGSNESVDPISPTLSIASSVISNVSKSDSGIESLSQSPPESEPLTASKQVDDLMKYLGNLSMEQALAKIEMLLESHKIDPTLLSKMISDDYYHYSSTMNNADQASNVASNYGLNFNSTETTFKSGQNKVYLPERADFERQAALDISNLPPPEYLRNMPPPNAYSLVSPSLLNSQKIPIRTTVNSLPAYSQPTSASKHQQYNYHHHSQMMIERQLSQLNTHSNHVTQIPAFLQTQNIRSVVDHNLSGPKNINNWQGSLGQRSGGAYELHIRLEECFDQFKKLQAERMRTEYEIARMFPDIKISTYENVTQTITPQSSLRVDRLISDQLREHATMLEMCRKIENFVAGKSLNDGIKVVLSNWIDIVRQVHLNRKNQAKSENETTATKAKNVSVQEQKFNEIGDPYYARQTKQEQEVALLAKSLFQLTIVTRKLRSILYIESQKFSCSKEGATSFDRYMKNDEACTALI